MENASRDRRRGAGGRGRIGPPLLSFLALCLGGAAAAQELAVTDVGLESGLQAPLGVHQRGRALVAADFDDDGRIDFYVGTPGDRSFVVRNVTPPGGALAFEVAQVLLEGSLAWGAVGADLDDDGDVDLFVTNGGNEDVAFDVAFRNLWVETGVLQFEDVTTLSGLAGPVPPGAPGPIATASANAAAGDVDRDGDVDLFVSVNVEPTSAPELLGRNLLWRNDGGWSFTDVTDASGLGTSAGQTRHSTLFDFDNDGDLDLHENNFREPNVLWRSLLVETGQLAFEDATAALSSPPGEDLSYPYRSFVSCATDFDNDGWEDLLVYMRGDGDLGESPYPAGHALFRNLAGGGFENVAHAAGLNAPFQGFLGVMGSQVGDVDNDGRIDVFIGNGGPPTGTANQLFLNRGPIQGPPQFLDATALIDFPAPDLPGLAPEDVPSYPYRTHGTAVVDLDGDGQPELPVINGGPASMPDRVREPNRLFRIVPATPRGFFKVRLRGDGVRVSRDAVGSRLALTVSRGGGAPWTLHRTLHASSCFSANNGFEVLFGLADADAVHQLRVLWPDGWTTTMSTGLAPNGAIVVERAEPIFADGLESGTLAAWSSAVP